MTTGFSKWEVFLNHRVVIWFPKTTRECFMYGFRWRDNFIGVVVRGEEIDPRQEVYYERVRNIEEVLAKEDDMLLTALTRPDYNNNASVRNDPKASRQVDRDMELGS